MQKTRFLDIVSEYFEVHATVGTNGQGKFTIPSYIKNHGVLQRKDLMKLLRSAKVQFFGSTMLKNAFKKHTFVDPLKLFV